MSNFSDTVETIGEGAGFALFGSSHLIWLAICIATILICCFLYRKRDVAFRARMRKTVAVLLVADELFKVAMLLLYGNYMAKYLPLHLCSINIFLIVVHAWRPSKLLDNFLYLICIPAAVAALLFPSWTSLPVLNFMHLHSFTIHILLALYPLMLLAGGDIKPAPRYLPKCLLLLVGMAIPLYVVNLAFDTNFMFLMYPEAENPLCWFRDHWGNHLYGYPILIALVIALMYLPAVLLKKRRSAVQIQPPA